MAIRFEPGQRGERKPASPGCLWLFLTPFFIFGLVSLWIGIRKGTEGSIGEGLRVAGFAVVFLSVAGLFLWLGIRSNRRNKARQQLIEEHADAPWLWRADWRAGRIRSSQGKEVVLHWVMAVAFLAVPLPALLAIPEELEEGNKLILIALVFPLSGLLLLVSALRATVRMRKFGHSELELHTLPGVIGGTLSGALEIPSKVRAETGFNLRLLCIRRTTSGSGKNRSTRESVLWEEEKTILRDFLEYERDKTGLPVFFKVPFDQPQSLDGNPAIIWRLEVKADVPGVDYAAHFDVPVFKTSESRADALPEEDPTESFQPPAAAWVPPANSRIKVTETMHSETEVWFPAARNVGVLLVLLVFLAIWTGALWFMIEASAPLLFPLVFGLLELLLVILALQMLFHSVRVAACGSHIEVQHGFLVLRWKHRIETSDIDSINLRKGMQSGTKVYYDLRVRTKSGRKLGAGGRIPDKKHARWLMDRLHHATGLQHSRS